MRAPVSGCTISCSTSKSWKVSHTLANQGYAVGLLDIVEVEPKATAAIALQGFSKRVNEVLPVDMEG